MSREVNARSETQVLPKIGAKGTPIESNHVGQGAKRMGLNIDELSPIDATAQAELVRRRELTPLELVDAAIARIERINPTINAVISP